MPFQKMYGSEKCASLVGLIRILPSFLSVAVHPLQLLLRPLRAAVRLSSTCTDN
jgi:hypothetical protein